MIDMTKAGDYRKRADAVRKKTGKDQSAVERGRLVRMAKALNDMADNEEWLEGQGASKPK